MNSKDFIQAIRKVIREEVRSAVREELSIIGETINESRNISIKKPAIKQSVIAAKPKYKAEPVKKSYVNNSMLNDILNDTAGYTAEGPKAYLEEQLDYNDYSEWPTMQSRPGQRQSPAVLTDIDGRKIDVNQLASTAEGQAVVQALTKDYSSLMKAIDKKKGK